jgi:plasmid stabilization system protein ParE
MKLRIEVEAEDELREAMVWYDSQQAGLGLDLLAEVDDGIQRILRDPHRFANLESVPEERAVRRLLLRRFPYGVIYEVLKDEIHVLAIAHNRRKPGYWRSRK